MGQKTNLLKFLLALILITTYWACETSEDGCLDLLSKNYGFQSVNACDSCCVYPDFNISLNLFNDSIPNALNDTLIVESNDSIIFSKIDLLLSEFEFVGQSVNYSIRDSIFINDQVVRDDYVYFQSPSTLEVGQTRFQDTLNSISCYLGFNTNSLENYLPFENINSSSQIDLALDSLYNKEDDQYFFSRFTIELGDSVRQIYLVNPNIKLEFETDVFIGAGTDWNVDFHLDLSKLIVGLTSEMTNEAIAETFEANFVSSLELK